MRMLRIRLIVWFWRWGQRLGPMGSVGCISLLLATCIATWAGFEKQKIHSVGNSQDSMVVLPQGEAVAEPSRDASLPFRADLPALFDGVRGAFVDAKMVWPEAAYKYSSASNDSLAHVEVRTAFKGTYPQAKALVAEIMSRYPLLGVRAWTMVRPNADTPELEVSMTWVVFFRDQGDQNSLVGGAP